jgi:hypothetical protein
MGGGGVDVVVDTAMPLNHDLQTTYVSKINKYVPVVEEIKHMWQIEWVSIWPLIVSITGIIPRSFSNELANLMAEILVVSDI